MVLPMLNFDDTVPASSHNPSIDQPVMLQNNQSEKAIWPVDHIGFDTNGSGYHQQVRMPAESAPTVIAGFGGLYCNTATGETNLFYTPDASGNIYQLTRAKTANYALFGTNTAYQNPGAPTAANPVINGGWTFLPGGLIMMYGLAAPTGSTGTITFPFAFPNTVFSVTMNLMRPNTGATVQWYLNTVSTSQFTYTTSSGTGTALGGFGIYFTALGN